MTTNLRWIFGALNYLNHQIWCKYLYWFIYRYSISIYETQNFCLFRIIWKENKLGVYYYIFHLHAHKTVSHLRRQADTQVCLNIPEHINKRKLTVLFLKGLPKEGLMLILTLREYTARHKSPLFKYVLR